MLSIISPGVLLVLLAAQLAAQFLGSLKWRPKRLCVSMKGAGRRTTGKNTTSKIAFCQHMQLLPTDVAYGNNRTPRWRFQVWEDRGASPSHTAVIQPCGCWGNWVFPHKSIFFFNRDGGLETCQKIENYHAFPKWKNASCQRVEFPPPSSGWDFAWNSLYAQWRFRGWVACEDVGCAKFWFSLVLMCTWPNRWETAWWDRASDVINIRNLSLLA